MDDACRLIVAAAFNAAVQGRVVAFYCRNRHPQALTDDLKQFCDHPSDPDGCIPLSHLLHGSRSPDRPLS